MRNDHYGVRKKARRLGKWGMKQNSIVWKFGTQNMVATYTLTLRKNLEYFLKSILGMLYVISIAWKVRSPTFQMVYKLELKWRSYDHLKITMQSWRIILKWFRNSTYEFEIHFEMTPISNSPTVTLMFRLLYLGNCI